MKIEHFAIQVSDPVSVAQWYVLHLGMQIKRSAGAPSFMHFLAACDGAVLIEIYHNPNAATPDYRNMDPLVLHLAFSCDDQPGTIKRLSDAGATLVSGPVITDAGDELTMLRDPWGLAIQLVKRREPMLN